MKAFTLLTAKVPFAFQSEGKGRVVQVKQGDQFEVTSSSLFAEQNKAVQIMRKGKGKLGGGGYLFSLAQIGEFFEVEA